MVLHPWHEVSVGSNPPENINGIIEIPKGSRAKYEIDKPSGLIKLDRVIYASMYYPLNYGFIPQTLGEDHDPLDIVVLTQVSVVPLCLIPSKVIGVMRMVDRGEADDKIIAVLENDNVWGQATSLNDVPKILVERLCHYFSTYKLIPGRQNTVSIEQVYDADHAFRVVQASMADYLDVFGEHD